MTIALLNTTPIVGKLVERLAQKRGDVLNDPADGTPADIVIVDDSVAERYDAKAARALGRYTLYVGSRFDAMPEGFDAVLGKPFLPEELNGLLDNAEVALGAAVERHDIFDADEAAAEIEADAAGEEPIFNPDDVDELKALLDAVESEASEDAPSVSELEAQIEAALETMEPEAWEQPVEEILYDADAAEQMSAVQGGDDFEGIDLHARGVEALQDLMAILSDESVARALKEMGVRIDISFGEKR